MRLLFLGHQPENPSDLERGPRLRELLSRYTSPGTAVELAYPDDFPGAQAISKLVGQSSLTGLHHAMATSALVRKIVWAEEQGFDAVVQSNHFDPGVEAARWAVRIPVVGLMRAAMHVATMLADRVGVLVPLAAHVPYTRRMLRTYGLDGFVADMRPLGIYSSDMRAQKDEISERAVSLMRAMVEERGAEIVVPLGGALIPQVVAAADLEREVGVPVTDNYALGIRTAEMLVATGLTHSPVTYPHTRLRDEDFTARAYD